MDNSMIDTFEIMNIPEPNISSTTRKRRTVKGGKRNGRGNKTRNNKTRK
jgi:hypothetical protein